MKLILQIDGGGIKGVIPATVVTAIEKATGKCSSELFDLMSGTSTGSIITGLLVSGVPANVILDLYLKGDRYFVTNNIFRRLAGGAKYKRSELLDTINDIIAATHGAVKTVGEAKTRWISNTYNKVSGRTHYQYSWSSRFKDLAISKVISWSALSAEHYFGMITEPDYRYKVSYQRDKPTEVVGAVFYDGGQGIANCTLDKCIDTCYKLGWLGQGSTEQVNILSLGCGAKRLFTPYSKARRSGRIRRAISYISQSRDEEVYDKLESAAIAEEVNPNLTVTRLDVTLPAKEDALDALKYIQKFDGYGSKLIDQIPSIFLG